MKTHHKALICYDLGVGRGAGESELGGGAARSAEVSAERVESLTRLAEARDWIPDPAEHLSHSLTAHHPTPPVGVDPLEGLHPDIRELPAELQLHALVERYGGAAALSYGMTLVMLQAHESRSEETLRARAEEMLALKLALGYTLEEAVQSAWERCQEDEAKLCWASDELGLPRDWVLHSMRSAALSQAESAGPVLRADLRREAELTERWGEYVPEGFDALADLPENVRDLSRSEQLSALRGAYADLIYDRVALSEYDLGVESPGAWEIQARISKRANESGAPISEELDILRADVSAREAHLVWASRALTLPATGVLRHLESEAREQLSKF